MIFVSNDVKKILFYGVKKILYDNFSPDSFYCIDIYHRFIQFYKNPDIIRENVFDVELYKGGFLCINTNGTMDDVDLDEKIVKIGTGPDSFCGYLITESGKLYIIFQTLDFEKYIIYIDDNVDNASMYNGIKYVKNKKLYQAHLKPIIPNFDTNDNLIYELDYIKKLKSNVIHVEEIEDGLYILNDNHDLHYFVNGGYHYTKSDVLVITKNNQESITIYGNNEKIYKTGRFKKNYTSEDIYNISKIMENAIDIIYINENDYIALIKNDPLNLLT